MIKLDTITSPHSGAYLSVNKQISILQSVATFTMPELSAKITQSTPVQYAASSAWLAEYALRDWIERGAAGCGLVDGLPRYRVTPGAVREWRH